MATYKLRYKRKFPTIFDKIVIIEGDSPEDADENARKQYSELIEYNFDSSEIIDE